LEKNPSREIFGNFGNFSDFRNSEIREFFGNFPEIPEIPENPENRPGKIDHFGGVYKRLQPETTKKPPKVPPEIPGKSPTFSENFRKFPEIPENPGSRPGKIGHFEGVYKRLQPETTKKPPNFPSEIRGKFRKSKKSRKFRKILKTLEMFVQLSEC